MKVENVLAINTSQPGKVEVSLTKDEQKFEQVSEQKFGSQVLLDLIMKILEQANLELKDLTEIEVNVGPGSFTGIKVGVSVANALGFSLGIPVNGKRLETDLKYS